MRSQWIVFLDICYKGIQITPMLTHDHKCVYTVVLRDKCTDFQIVRNGQ